MSPDIFPTDRRALTALLTVCCLVTFGCYFAVSMRLPVMPLHAIRFGVSTSQIGVINAAFYLMAGLMALPSGTLSDLLGRRRLALFGTVILFVGMLLLFFGRSFLQLSGIYLLLGIGIAAFGPTMMSWVAEITPPTHLGRAYGWYTTALFCGLGLGPAFGGVLGEWLGYRAVFAIGAALVAVNLWSVQRFLPATATAGAHRQRRESWRSNAGRKQANRPLIGSWLGTFGANIIAGVFFTFMPLLAHARGLDADQIGLVYLTQAGTNAVSRIPFGAISDRIGRRKYQALFGVCLATLAIAAFAPAETFAHFLLAAFFLGLSLAIAFTAIGALIAETSDPRSGGLAMGGYNTFIYFGLMAGSIGFGPLMENMGFGQGFLVAGGINLFFAAGFAWFMMGYTKGDVLKTESL